VQPDADDLRGIRGCEDLDIVGRKRLVDEGNFTVGTRGRDDPGLAVFVAPLAGSALAVGVAESDAVHGPGIVTGQYKRVRKRSCRTVTRPPTQPSAPRERPRMQWNSLGPVTRR